MLNSYFAETPTPAQTVTEPEAVVTPMAETPEPAGSVQDATYGDMVGLGRTRDSIQSVFEQPEVGFTFESATAESATAVGGTPRVVGQSADGRAIVQLIGPAENLVSASVIVSLSSQTPADQIANNEYLLGLMKWAVPSWTEGTAWVRDNIDTALEADSAATTYAHLQIQLQSLQEYDALLLSVADQNWGIPALATIPIPEPAETAALADQPQVTATPTSNVQATASAQPDDVPQTLSTPRAQEPKAAESAVVIDDIVREADISEVVNLALQALTEHRGLSSDDQDAVYRAIGRTQQALDQLYETGATGDVFRAAEGLLLTQLDVLREVETAVLSEDIADMKTVVPRLVDLGERRLVFDRQLGTEDFAPAYTEQELDVVSIVRDDAALRSAMSEVMAALAQGRPVDLDISHKVYQALGETTRGLDLIDEIGQTGDVFRAAVSVLQHRRQLLIDLERAVISGNIGDLRAVAEDWVELSQEQLKFERQLSAHSSDGSGDEVPLLTPPPARNANPTATNQSGTQRGESGSTTDQSTPDAHDTYSASAEQTNRIPRYYRVQEGDTLGGIAARFGKTVGHLARLNNISSAQSLKPGSLLLISMPPYRYQVHSGDTLSEIAYRHGLDVETLMQINQLNHPDLLFIGQKLLIAEDSSESP